jgi:hypothetical protein
MFEFFFLIKKEILIYNKYDRFWTEFDVSKKTFNNINSTEINAITKVK